MKEIRLFSERAYNPGDIVSGEVYFSLNKSETKEISVRLVGRAKTHIYERRQSYSSYEKYIDEEYQFPVTTIPAGESHYPFRFQLPRKLPSSFTCDNGDIKYTLTLTTHPSVLSVRKITKIITVIGIIDLNNETCATQSAELKLSKKLFLSCTNAELQFHMKISKVGFVPGENVEFNVKMWNMSSSSTTRVRVVLLQCTRVYAASDASCKCGDNARMESAETKLETINYRSVVDPGDVKIWEGKIQIPSNTPTVTIVPSRLEWCTLINLEYFIEFRMDVYGSRTFKGRIPITIGNVPFGCPNPNQSEQFSSFVQDFGGTSVFESKESWTATDYSSKSVTSANQTPFSNTNQNHQFAHNYGWNVHNLSQDLNRGRKTSESLESLYENV